jgi:DNA-directed RNA polymerase subunit RPC12/RpoP
MMKPSPRTYTVVCDTCGENFERLAGRKKTTCFDCGVSAVVEATRQQKARKGPIYEKAVSKNLRFWRAEAKRLGIR